MSEKSLYEDMEAAGLVAGHRESDLYVQDTDEAREILTRHGKAVDGWNVVSFRSEIAGEGAMLEIPFAYQPFWGRKMEDAPSPR